MNKSPLKSPDDELEMADITTYQAGVAQSAAHRLLKKFVESCLKQHDLTMMQWFVIGTIYDAGDAGIGVTRLSKAMDTNVPYITNMLNTLVAKGIVLREFRDGNNRSKFVKINPSFERTLIDIETDLRQQMRQTIYANITPAELKTYLTVLYKLSYSLEDLDS